MMVALFEPIIKAHHNFTIVDLLLADALQLTYNYLHNYVTTMYNAVEKTFASGPNYVTKLVNNT